MSRRQWNRTISENLLRLKHCTLPECQTLKQDNFWKPLKHWNTVHLPSATETETQVSLSMPLIHWNTGQLLSVTYSLIHWPIIKVHLDIQSLSTPLITKRCEVYRIFLHITFLLNLEAQWSKQYIFKIIFLEDHLNMHGWENTVGPYNHANACGGVCVCVCVCLFVF